MGRAVDVFFTHASPWTYLGWARFRELAGRTGASVTYRPIQMAPVFEASGGLPLAKRPRQRQANRLQELRRWRERLGIPINLEPRFFPVDDRAAAHLAIAHQQGGGDPGPLSQAIMAAIWEQERNVADSETLRSIVAEQGLDPDALFEVAADPAVQAIHDANTRLAIERGVFGVPTFAIGDELFWGQDRLDFVERALQA